MLQERYLESDIAKTDYGAYTVYTLGSKGMSVLRAAPGSDNAAVRIPVPNAVRELEEKEAAARQQRLSKLRAAGVDLSTVPQDEIAAGHGAVIDAHLAWAAKLELLERTTRKSTEHPDLQVPLEEAVVKRNVKKAAQLRALLARLTEWRLEEAKRTRMAPHFVLEEHLMRKIAYTCSSGPIAAEALRELGARSGIDTLVAISAAWCAEVGVGPVASASEGSPMVFSDADRAFQPARPWAFAVYKPIKARGNIASWESSYTRFQRGVHLQSIGSNPDHGKPIKPITVFGHVLEGMVHGRVVNLVRLAEQAPSPPPNSTEWEKLELAMVAAGVDVVADKPSSYDIIAKIDDNLAEIIALPWADRSDEQQAAVRPWHDAITWFNAFKRVGYKPTFQADDRDGAAAKRQRIQA